MKKENSAQYTELKDIEDTSGHPVHPETHPAIQAWPTQPKPLSLTRNEQVLWTAFDIVLVALPVLLIIKTGLCIYAYNTDKGFTGVDIDSVSLLTQGLIALNAQLVTLFTIVFVTIMSTFVKRYALWRAQRGAYVSDLEQLQGSVSLPSTLKLIWSLRSFDIRSAILALVWSFYYLGSQAIKLEYRLALSEDYHKVNAAIMKADAPSYFDADLDIFFNKSGFSLQDFRTQRAGLDGLNTNFGAVIVDILPYQNKNGQLPNPGTRNGPLIPDYNIALQQVQHASLSDKILRKSGGWVDVSKQSQLSGSYISYTGQSLWLDEISFDNGSVIHNTISQPFLGTYTLNNISYLNVSCGEPVVSPIWAFPNGTSSNTSVSFNMTFARSDAPRDNNDHVLREFVYWYRGFTIYPIAGLDATDSWLLTFNGTYTLSAIQSTCNITTKYIDLQVQCITTGCYPYRMRWANNSNEANATSYSTPFDDDFFAKNFLSNLTFSTGHQNDLMVSTLVSRVFFYDYYLNSSFWSIVGPAQSALNKFGLLSITSLKRSSDLTKGFNTYYMLSQAVIGDYIQPNMTELIYSKNKEDDLFKLIEARGAAFNQGYRIYWQWVPIDFTACSILLAAAIGAYWLRINTLAPDIFGYVSSLTRDNPHIQLPTEGSTLSGIDSENVEKCQSQNRGRASWEYGRRWHWQDSSSASRRGDTSFV
ncbi:hypothetical protein H2198_004502 [Neophaeococcomyces mojaviensis]|uniref:Uncharacterized protein n=1 Tax=Neophaeococcomyces mojaviensis TaxID=3383035 RepID=A0ACC3A8G0_9EURO|nr:hypothetical protein H2198_004502 [Knufia sp. JES_112]